MGRYRKKPVVVEAVQYDGGGNLNPRHEGKVPDWMWDAFRDGTLQPTNGRDPLMVHTPHGPVEVAPMDWIIRGPHGDLYPCKPEIFAETYEDE